MTKPYHKPNDVLLGQSFGELIKGKTVELWYRHKPEIYFWCNFYIRAPGVRGQRNYHGAWNGERIARHPDMKIIKSKYPNVYEWTIKLLRDSPIVRPKTLDQA